MTSKYPTPRTYGEALKEIKHLRRSRGSILSWRVKEDRSHQDRIEFVDNILLKIYFHSFETITPDEAYYLSNVLTKENFNRLVWRSKIKNEKG